MTESKLKWEQRPSDAGQMVDVHYCSLAEGIYGMREHDRSANTVTYHRSTECDITTLEEESECIFAEMAEFDLTADDWTICTLEECEEYGIEAPDTEVDVTVEWDTEPNVFDQGNFWFNGKATVVVGDATTVLPIWCVYTDSQTVHGDSRKKGDYSEAWHDGAMSGLPKITLNKDKTGLTSDTESVSQTLAVCLPKWSYHEDDLTEIAEKITQEIEDNLDLSISESLADYTADDLKGMWFVNVYNKQEIMGYTVIAVESYLGCEKRYFLDDDSEYDDWDECMDALAELVTVDLTDERKTPDPLAEAD